MNVELWLEVVIQLCRIQVQREREKLAMTPKMRGALESLKKMQHHADAQADKLTKRIENEVMPKLNKGFAKAHGRIDDLGEVVDGMEKFAEDLIGDNGAPLDDSEKSSDAPRSSEVAQR